MAYLLIILLVVREPSVYSVTTMFTPWNGVLLTTLATLTYFTLLTTPLPVPLLWKS